MASRGLKEQEYVVHSLFVAIGIGCPVGLLLGVIMGNIPFGVAAGFGAALFVACLRIATRKRRSAIQPPEA